MRILSVANQKGGVGKTTTTVNLATALAAVGKRVLIVDLDPQGNASTGLGVPHEKRSPSSYDILFNPDSIFHAVYQTGIPRLAVIPSTLDLLGVELQLASLKDKAYRLQSGLSLIPRADCDYVLIDCPPSLNLLTINALVASHGVLVPLQCEFYALEGLSQLLSTVEDVRTGLNPHLEVQGIVMTMYDPRNNLSQQVVRDVRDVMGDLVYQTIIPRNVRVSEAPSYGKPVLLYDFKCLGSQAYVKLATEVIQREKRLVAA